MARHYPKFTSQIPGRRASREVWPSRCRWTKRPKNRLTKRLKKSKRSKSKPKTKLSAPSTMASTLSHHLAGSPPKTTSNRVNQRNQLCRSKTQRKFSSTLILADRSQAALQKNKRRSQPKLRRSRTLSIWMRSCRESEPKLCLKRPRQLHLALMRSFLMTPKPQQTPPRVVASTPLRSPRRQLRSRLSKNRSK